MKADFIELHFHDDYGSNTRLTDTTNKIEPCMDYAASIGLKGLAITDHESLSAHIKALQYLTKVKEKYPDFQLILGNEIYLCNDTEPFVTEEGKTRYNIESKEFYHFILLAKDAIGHRQLRELSSLAWSRCYSYKNIDRVPTFKSDVTNIIQKLGQGHLIASTACLGGEFPKLVLEGNADKALEFVRWCQQTFGEEDFYIELQPGLTEEQKLFNERAIKFAKFFKVPWIITNDVHYMTADKREMHKVFLQSHEEERETGDFYESTYFKTPDEMLERMLYLGEENVLKGFTNTLEIGAKCKDAGDYGLFHTTIVPQRVIMGDPYVTDLLAEWYGDLPSLAFLAKSPYAQDRFFLQECEKGIIKKGIKPTYEVAARIDIEAQQLLAISEKLGCRLTSYYNLMQEVEDIIWQVSIIGPGRGSACCLYCAYLMDITSVDSLKYNLPYWRHTHASKVSLPDIDIDLLPSKRPQIFEMLKDKYGRDRCLNIITFKTETLKSAIKTACRGIGIDNDVAQEMSNLVPITRGRVWSFKECLNGNEDNGFAPITELLNKIAEYPGLQEAVQEIEGLVNGRGVHASGFYIFSQPYLEQNSLMKTPTGLDCTCWEMADSDAAGALKFDLLVTDAVEGLQLCIEQLVKDGYMEWQGSLKDTYNKYLHPDVLNYTDPRMWDYVGKGAIVDLFQFMSDVGIQAVDKIKPRTLQELATTSSIMRLMGEGESPTDRYVRLRSDINQWYEEMNEAGLTPHEQEVIRKHLESSYGCSTEQETAMELSMDPEIAGFDMSKADLLRKIIGKKQVAKLPMIKEMYFTSGKEQGTSQKMLNYVWEHGFLPQLGYSFNRPHVLSYAIVALQEMNLFTFYPHIYWQTARLTVNASAIDSDDDLSSSASNTNYGKIATAISNMQKQGVKIALPDINSADFGFKPDAENDQIIFGLKAINSVNDELASMIVERRPYADPYDFYQKLPGFPIKSYLNLIKAGAFDACTPGQTRVQILHQFLEAVGKEKVPEKASLNMQNFASVASLQILPREYEFPARLFFFRQALRNAKWSFSEATPLYIFFDAHLLPNWHEGEEYRFEENGSITILEKPFEKWYKKAMAPVSQWLKTKEAVDAYNKAAVAYYAQELWQKYCSGTIPHWEMESLSFYYTEHELAHAPAVQYQVDDFFSLPKTPMVAEQTEKYTLYKLNRIWGTVLDKNKNRHSITLLTPTGVVNVKFYAGSFAHYDKRISKVLPDGKKKEVLEESWFQRGAMLLITGIRRDDVFFPKSYKRSIFSHSVCRINAITTEGLDLQTERTNQEEN